MLDTYTNDAGERIIVPCKRCGCVINDWCWCQDLKVVTNPIWHDMPIRDKRQWNDCDYCGDTLVKVANGVCEDCDKALGEIFTD